MQAVVIDVYESEAYLSLQDGSNICVGLTHLPSNIKAGTKISIQPGGPQMINHKLSSLIL